VATVVFIGCSGPGRTRVEATNAAQVAKQVPNWESWFRQDGLNEGPMPHDFVIEEAVYWRIAYVVRLGMGNDRRQQVGDR
jgi:hypothetical protein